MATGVPAMGATRKFDRPFVKEFVLSVSGDVPKMLADLRAQGYHVARPLVPDDG